MKAGKCRVRFYFSSSSLEFLAIVFLFLILPIGLMPTSVVFFNLQHFRNCLLRQVWIKKQIHELGKKTCLFFWVPRLSFSVFFAVLQLFSLESKITRLKRGDNVMCKRFLWRCRCYRAHREKIFTCQWFLQSALYSLKNRIILKLEFKFSKT